MASGVRGVSGDNWAATGEVDSLGSVSGGLSELAELTLRGRGGGLLRWIG